MQTKVKTGLPQIYSIDFQARACTTSRWLCEEIVKGSPRSPLPIATRGCKSKPLAAGASGVSGATSVADAHRQNLQARLDGRPSARNLEPLRMVEALRFASAPR